MVLSFDVARLSIWGDSGQLHMWGTAEIRSGVEGRSEGRRKEKKIVGKIGRARATISFVDSITRSTLNLQQSRIRENTRRPSPSEDSERR